MEESKALIALLGVLLGVLLGKGLEAAIERRRRHNREIDMVFALHAEIAVSKIALKDQCRGEQATLFLEEPDPAGPSGSVDFVFESLKGDFRFCRRTSFIRSFSITGWRQKRRRCSNILRTTLTKVCRPTGRAGFEST